VGDENKEMVNADIKEPRIQDKPLPLLVVPALRNKEMAARLIPASPLDLEPDPESENGGKKVAGEKDIVWRSK